MTYRIELNTPVRRTLSKLDKKVAKRVVSKLYSLQEDPRPRGCRKLQGEVNHYRIRIGAFRVIYSIEDNKLIVFVLRIANRKDAYR